MDLTPELAKVYSEVNNLRAFCQEIFYEEGLRSMAYIETAVRCVLLDRANRAVNPNP